MNCIKPITQFSYRHIKTETLEVVYSSYLNSTNESYGRLNAVTIKCYDNLFILEIRDLILELRLFMLEQLY